MTKKAFIVDSWSDYLPLVDHLEEVAPADQLLQEEDFGGCVNIRIKEMLPIRFKQFLHELGSFTYGEDIINNYSNLLRDVYCDTTSINSIKMPIIKGIAVLDLAIQCTQQEIFFPSGARPYDDIIEYDRLYGKFITGALLSIDGSERLATEIVARFEPNAQKNISARLLYATTAGRVVRACEYMAEWVELANITNEYGYTPKQWDEWGKRTSSNILLIRRQSRPERNIIAEELKDYLLRLELEASKAISYIIAYNNLPEDILNYNDAWKYEGLKWTLSIPELKEYNLKQIDLIKSNLKKARESLQKHFGILAHPALAYPNEIYTNNPLVSIMPRSAYMFFSHTITDLVTSVTSNFSSNSEFEGFIYKPPYSAPKNSIDLDIISMESNVLKSNNAIGAAIIALDIENQEAVNSSHSLQSLYMDCKDAVNSAVKCLSFSHMRYAAYMEQDHTEYLSIYNNYIKKLIAPAIHNLVILMKKIEQSTDKLDNACLPSKEAVMQNLNLKIDRLLEMLPTSRLSGSFIALSTSDVFEPIQREIQILNGKDGVLEQNVVAVAHYRNIS